MLAADAAVGRRDREVLQKVKVKVKQDKSQEKYHSKITFWAVFFPRFPWVVAGEVFAEAERAQEESHSPSSAHTMQQHILVVLLRGWAVLSS